MTSRSDSEILVITTHYPFGTIEENWIGTELEEFARRFAKVHLFPVKELEGCRDLPHGVELWPPLASLDRKAFFARHVVTPKTWRYFAEAMRECAAGPGIARARAILSLKFACYRTAFERHSRLKTFLAARKPKTVYAYWGHIPALAVPMAHEYGAGTCVRYHAGDLYVYRSETGGFYPWRREIRTNSGQNVFISEHGKKYFLGLADGVPGEMNEVFRLGSRDRGAPRSRAAKDLSETIVMVSASWIYPNKRVDLIAELAGELAKSRPVVWHHFGSGSYSEFDAQVSKARSLGVEVVLHGQVATEQLQEFYRRNEITLFVNLSWDEGIPVSIMEALNADIPVLATAVGGVPEVVLEGRSGLLVAREIPGGPPALAKEVIRALQPGGCLTGLQPRKVWGELCDARVLAARLADKLVALSNWDTN